MAWRSTDRAFHTGDEAIYRNLMMLPLVYLATPFLAFANYSVAPWATWLGVTVQLPFPWLFWRSHADLDHNWSPGLDIREGHGLLTNGADTHIRHAMYPAIWIAPPAQALPIQIWIAGAIRSRLPTRWFPRMPTEEALMQEAFGAAYDSYARRRVISFRPGAHTTRNGAAPCGTGLSAPLKSRLTLGLHPSGFHPCRGAC